MSNNKHNDKIRPKKKILTVEQMLTAMASRETNLEALVDEQILCQNVQRDVLLVINYFTSTYKKFQDRTLDFSTMYADILETINALHHDIDAGHVLDALSRIKFYYWDSYDKLISALAFYTDDVEESIKNDLKIEEYKDMRLGGALYFSFLNLFRIISENRLSEVVRYS